jgi:hypothetical protein
MNHKLRLKNIVPTHLGEYLTTFLYVEIIIYNCVFLGPLVHSSRLTNSCGKNDLFCMSFFCSQNSFIEIKQYVGGGVIKKIKIFPIMEVFLE